MKAGECQEEESFFVVHKIALAFIRSRDLIEGRKYLPEQMRARVHAFFSVIMSIGGILFQLLAGILGQIMPYRYAARLDNAGKHGLSDCIASKRKSPRL